MLKTPSTKSAKPRKGIVGVSYGSKKKQNDRVEPVRRNEIDDGKDKDNEIRKNQKMSKSKKLSKSKKIVRSDFLIPKTRLAFTKLRGVFVKALILYHFDPKHYIQVETSILSYAIGEVFSHLTSDDLR